jgi:demethylmenaquinone methyltransferase/2-methoxy-6-polyprenyl-1,4-benzoquinol methylase
VAASRVVAVGFSPEMARRARHDWPFRTEMVIADVLDWNLDCPFADVVVSSFGLKTFDRGQQAELAGKVAQLKPGGRFSFIEISVPPSVFLRVPFMFYLKRLIPLIGRLLLGNPDCYRMLGVYTEAFGNARHFAGCLKRTGLDAVAVSYCFGCATGVRGGKPPSAPVTQVT